MNEQRKKVSIELDLIVPATFGEQYLVYDIVKAGINKLLFDAYGDVGVGVERAEIKDTKLLDNE